MKMPEDPSVRTRISADSLPELALSIDDGVSGAEAKDGAPLRLVVVRYFLDRPGYGLHNSVARFWFHPPPVISPAHVQIFLKQQGIALPGLLVEIFLDRFESFMVLEGCEASGIEWDVENTTFNRPGILNVRLTDMAHAQWMEESQLMEDVNNRTETTASLHVSGKAEESPPHVAPELVKPREAAPPPHAQNQQANSTPLGLFSFSMMVGLETTALTMSLFPGLVEPSFRLAWGPYMFFVGGLLQVIVGTLQVFRNNLYGAVAFLGFGTFWFANGTTVILENHFSGEGTLAEELLTGTADQVGAFVRTLFILAFTGALLTQTFVMSKLSTTLITLLTFKLIVQACRVMGDQHDGVLSWLQLIIGGLTSAFAFYVFLVEFTNNVYHKQVFKTFKWSEKHSPEEVYGAPGNVGTLHSKAARLRQANMANFGRTIRKTLPDFVTDGPKK